MDWEYIANISPDELKEDEKDELYNTVTWFDCDSGEPTIVQFKTLCKISQEILKYKGEQVETLLHELDEVATKQGEQEARKESDGDAKSSRSRSRLSSIEYENFEQRYKEMKAKFKKQNKIIDKSNEEINRLKKELVLLEKEKRQLEIDFKSRHDDSSSDISETVKDGHKELVETIHNKNKQMTDLLQDIEGIENDNSVLREKLTLVKDELSNATTEMNSLLAKWESASLQLNDAQETIQKLTSENELLQEELQEITILKQNVEDQFSTFTQEINARIDQWEKILTEKDHEISQLRSKTRGHSPESNTSSFSLENEHSHLSALQKLVKERDNQLLEIQGHLQEATKEMEENTQIIEKLKQEKNMENKKVVELTTYKTELKKQLKAAHERTQNLQDELSHLERMAQRTDKDMKQIVNKLKEDGNLDLSTTLSEMQAVKSDNRTLERQVMNLVKTSNKLQDTCDHLEKENSILRDKLGLSEDDDVSVGEYQSKKKLQRREHQKIKKQLMISEEKNLQFKLDIQKLNKFVSSLQDKLIDEGKKSELGHAAIEQSGEYEEEKRETSKDIVMSYNEVLLLIEENEALRKGMHEILNTLNSKKESSLKEIKSDTFEKLLRALDVKHISGWYHPAMRLQAEVHKAEGVNAELREQLRVCRVELESLKSEKFESSNLVSKPNPELNLEQIEQKISLKDVLILEDLNLNVENLLEKATVGSDKYREFLFQIELYHNQFCDIETQLKFVSNEYTSEKISYQEDIEKLKNENFDMNVKLEAAHCQISSLNQTETIEESTKIMADLKSQNLIITRKYEFLSKESARFSELRNNLKNELLTTQKVSTERIGLISRNNKSLRAKISMLENNLDNSVNIEDYRKVKKDLDNMTIKFRELMQDFKQHMNNNQTELNLVKKSNHALEQEKIEFKNKLLDCLTKLNIAQFNQNIDENLEVLTKKLSESEVNEIGERQRANHINNLYELVKEQLQKSEERFNEYEKYSKEIMHKNLTLQEDLKNAEQKLCEYVDVSVYNDLKKEYNELLELKEKLSTESNKLKEEKLISVVNEKMYGLWNSQKDQEFLQLKHHIVDLQSISDDKAVIAHISSDLLQARLSENECRNKCESLAMQLDHCQEHWMNELKLFDEEKEKLKSKEMYLIKKNCLIQELLENQKHQYFGFVPLTSDEKFIKSLKQIFENKHASFLNLFNARNIENESKIIKEQEEIELRNLIEAQKITKGDKEELRKLLNWQQEKKYIELDLIRYRRQAEFKQVQLQQSNDRIQELNEQISKLEEELFLAHRDLDVSLLQDSVLEESFDKFMETPVDLPEKSINFAKPEETQTENMVCDSKNEIQKDCENLKSELIKTKQELEAQEENSKQLKIKLNECEMNLSLFRKQLGDKQSQITFYEKHILEIQNKKDDTLKSQEDSGLSSIAPENVSEEIVSMKGTIKTLQDSLKQKEESILHYQSLIKEDRDNHSLAAARMQEELKSLKEKQKQFESSEAQADNVCSKSAIELYVEQVHKLERHSDELHTTVQTLESQLQSSRQEALRWRSLANDRLEVMEQLRKSLEEQHQKEIIVYKKDSDKWREEVLMLKEFINEHKNEIVNVQPELENILKNKDNKIHELTVLLRQTKNEAKRYMERRETEPKLSEMEIVKEQLLKEHDALRKRFEQLLIREKSARDEIRNLKGKLMKTSSRASVSARSDRSEKCIKDQLQKKISSLEEEVIHLKENLAAQIAINETHKIKIAEDFDRWNKQKHSQQTIEKLKAKLKDKDSEMEKLQQTCSGYRGLIERLEREKHNLENRIKCLRSNGNAVANNLQIETLSAENVRLNAELYEIKSRLEIQHHHSGGLGAAMLQEKLEAQERKLAVLEISAKGTTEIRAEIERLQTLISNLQKLNLRMESENIELKMDLEKAKKDIPYFREQIQHLENYIEVLKSEQRAISGPSILSPEAKKSTELERTVFVLKRVVEKLQAENKRLIIKRPQSDCAISEEKKKHELVRLKEQYGETIHKISQLEKELAMTKEKLKIYETNTNNKTMMVLSTELVKAKTQLEQKSQLLEKVKVLLHRAASKEKALLQEVAELKLEFEKNN